MPADKPLIYLILGAAGSGRREVLADLIEDGLAAEDRPAVLLAAGEAADPIDQKLGAITRWSMAPDFGIDAAVPEGATHLFLVTDGRRNPIDQIEAFKTWLVTQGGELARIICVVNCRLAEQHHPLLLWYDACIHFADVVLLNRRDGVPNKWIGDFEARYKGKFYPCLIELVKAGRVKNPALIVAPGALRLSLAFDPFEEAAVPDDIEIEIGGEPGDGGEEEKREEEDEEDEIKEDPYFARLAGGRRAKEIPDIAKYLDPVKT
jgi:hypothetical protein